MDNNTNIQLNNANSKSQIFMQAFKLVVVCLFSCVGMTLYMLGMINMPALCLLISGALWNYFVNINSFLAIIFSVIVGTLYSLFSVFEGLYINALLYVVFYIPLQFFVWIKFMDKKDMSISKDKKLSATAIYYLCVILVLTFACLFAIAMVNDYQVLPFFDVVVACMLGLSAVLQSFRYREFFIIKPFALFLVIMLWVNVVSINGLHLGALAIILMYGLYFIMDLASLCYFIIHNPEHNQLAEHLEVNEEGNKTIIANKIEEYRNMIEIAHNNNDKSDSILA